MTPAEKLIKIAENEQRVYDAGVEAGKAQGGTDWLYYANRVNNTFGGVEFPENTEFIGRFKGAVDYGYMFNNCSNLKSVKMITETPDTVLSMVAFCAIGSKTPTLELVDLSEFNKQYSNTFNMFSQQTKLKTVLGAMDLTSCTDATNMFKNNGSLEDVEFAEGTISTNLVFSACINLKAQSLNSIMRGHSKTSTGVTLTLPAYDIVKATYDAVYGDGAWDAIAAEYSNITFMYS